MKSFVILFEEVIKSSSFLRQFALPNKGAIPCYCTPRQEGAFLILVPAELDSTGSVISPASPSLDGLIRIPLHFVEAIVDSNEGDTIGFLASLKPHSLSPTPTDQ